MKHNLITGVNIPLIPQALPTLKEREGYKVIGGYPRILPSSGGIDRYRMREGRKRGRGQEIDNYNILQFGESCFGVSMGRTRC